MWQSLTDFDAFPGWNPFIRRIRGELKVGSKLEVFLQPSGTRGMTFRPTVKRIEVNRGLRWLGRLGIPWLCDGEHIFELDSLARTVFTSYNGGSSEVSSCLSSRAAWIGTRDEGSRR